MVITQRYLSVCSGIEAFTVAVQHLDYEPVAFAEIEDFPSRVLAHHYPNVPNIGDMTKIDVSKLGRVDGLVGGTPCQSFSIAGLRAGLNDERGNLTLEYVRLAHELRERNGLRWALWENVFGILSDSTNAFGCFVAALVGHDAPLVTPHGGRWPNAGMVAGPRARLAWRVLDSKHFGVPQRRRRVFVVVDFGDGPDPATVLFEPRSQGRSFAPGGQEGQDVAGTISSRTKGGGGLGTDMDLGVGLQTWPAKIAPTLNAHFGDKMGLENQHALNGARLFVPHQNPVAFGSKDYGADAGELSPTLKASGHNKSHANGGAPPAVAIAMRGRDDGAELEIGGDTANALRGADGGSSKAMAMIGPQVRRLTPIECEILQGFPRNWTAIPGLKGWRDLGPDEDIDDLKLRGVEIRVNKKTGKPRVNDPDGPRYRALGNSMTVEVINWMATRLEASLRHEPMPRWQPMQLWSKTHP